MSIDIFVVTHKKYKLPRYNIYKPIVAGAFEYDMDLFPKNYLKDDVGDNISHLHDLYSEYTVTYWAWKNSKADIIGINHYRRYFIKGGWFNYFLCLFNPSKLLDKFVLNEKDINTLFEEHYQCIMPKKQWRVNRTVREEFLSANSAELLNTVEKVIDRVTPEYSPYFTKVFDSTENYQKCICVMTKEYFDKYSNWIFDIFEELKKAGFNGSNREFAFLGERLINVWVEYQKNECKLLVKECFFINTEFPMFAVFKNHTELIIPRWIKFFLRIVSKLGIEIVIGNGNCKIQRRTYK